MVKLLVASNNAKKLKELEKILADAGIAGIELLPLSAVETYPEPVEDGRTFADNALIKARAGVQHTGLATIADDSGLAVEELNGMPGVLSARWSGSHGDDEANNQLLVGQMSHVPAERRAAAVRDSVLLLWGHLRGGTGFAFGLEEGIVTKAIFALWGGEQGASPAALHHVFLPIRGHQRADRHEGGRAALGGHV